MKNDKAWFNVGAKCNRRMKEAARNAHMVLKGIGVVERGTCYIKPGAMAQGGAVMMSLMTPLMIVGGFDGVEPPRCTRRTCAAFAGPVHRKTEIRGLGAAARRCGVSHTHLRKVLEGERKPSADLERRMRRLGLTPGAMAKEGK